MINKQTGSERPGTPPAADWRQPLAEIERMLAQATRSLAELRQSLESESAEASPEGAFVPTGGLAGGEAKPADENGHAAFERLWQRIDDEKLEQHGEVAPKPAKRGLDLLPKQYVVTVEDRESEVGLVALHRAFLSLAKIEDFSLMSYSNGTPVISLRTEGELDRERIGEVVAVATDRECEVIDQDNGKLFLRLSMREDG